MKTSLITGVLCATALAGAAAAEEWGDWTPLPGDHAISVRYAPSSSGTYTWAFRNDEPRTIGAMSFDYTFVDADTGKVRTESESLHAQLPPGAVAGGFVNYVANSRKAPAIKVKHLSYAPGGH